MSYGASRRRGFRRSRSPHKTRRNKRKPNYLLLFYSLATSALVSGVVSYALTTPKLMIAEVKIHGVRKEFIDEMAKAGYDDIVSVASAKEGFKCLGIDEMAKKSDSKKRSTARTGPWLAILSETG